MESSWGSPCSLPEWVDPSPTSRKLQLQASHCCHPLSAQPGQAPRWMSVREPAVSTSRSLFLKIVMKPLCCCGRMCPGCTVVIKATDIMDPIKASHLCCFIDTGMHTRCVCGGAWVLLGVNTENTHFPFVEP